MSSMSVKQMLTEMSGNELDSLSALIKTAQEERAGDVGVSGKGKAVCTATTKAGKDCPVAPVKGTSLCIAHTRQAEAQARKAGKAGKKGTKKAAKNTSKGKAFADVKANRAGAGVSMGELKPALVAGTKLVEFHSNAGARKVNAGLRKAGFTVSDMTKHADGSRTWDVSGHGHEYVHEHVKFAISQTAHHRRLRLA